MKKIKIDTNGIIKESNEDSYTGWNIYVEKFTDFSDKAFLITYKDPVSDNEYDEWVENSQQLEDYFLSKGFIVKWEN